MLPAKVRHSNRCEQYRALASLFWIAARSSWRSLQINKKVKIFARGPAEIVRPWNVLVSSFQAKKKNFENRSTNKIPIRIFAGPARVKIKGQISHVAAKAPVPIRALESSTWVIDPLGRGRHRTIVVLQSAVGISTDFFGESKANKAAQDKNDILTTW